MGFVEQLLYDNEKLRRDIVQVRQDLVEAIGIFKECQEDNERYYGPHPDTWIRISDFVSKHSDAKEDGDGR